MVGVRSDIMDACPNKHIKLRHSSHFVLYSAVNRTKLSNIAVICTCLSLLALLSVPAAAGAVGSPPPTYSCLPAGNTGLTAKIIAFGGQEISGYINATGCDVGIYVPPGANNVVIQHATITGANEHAIMAVNVIGLLITGNVVTGNGLAINANVSDNKVVELVGTSDSIVSRNALSNNSLDGGIALVDDGPIDPGAPNPGNLSGSSGNVVEYNHIRTTSPSEGGIVLAAFNAGAGVSNNLILGNVISGNSPRNPGAGDGQIVVAADAPGASLSNNTVTANIIDGSLLPGIVVHSYAPGDVISNTVIANNNIANSGGYPVGGSYTSANDPTNSTGIAVIAEGAPHEPTPPTVDNTIVRDNVVTGNTFGIWTCETSHTVVTGLLGNSTTSSTSCPQGP
jgi:Right handed beta helix region